MPAPPDDNELLDSSTGTNDLPVLHFRAVSVGSASRSSDGRSGTEGSVGALENDEFQGHGDFLQLSIRDLASPATLPKRSSAGSGGIGSRSVAEKSRRQDWRSRNAFGRDGQPRHSDGTPNTLEEALDLQDQEILGRTSQRANVHSPRGSPSSSFVSVDGDSSSSSGGDSFFSAFAAVRKKLSSGLKDANDSPLMPSARSRLGCAVNSMLLATDPASFNEFDDEPSEYENDSFVDREDQDQDDNLTEYGNESSVYANDSFVDRLDNEDGDDVFEDDDESAYTEDDLRDMMSAEHSLSMGAENNFSLFGGCDPQASSARPASPMRQFWKQFLTEPPAVRNDSNEMAGRISVQRRPSPTQPVHVTQTATAVKPPSVPSRKPAMKPIKAPYYPPAPIVSEGFRRSEGDVERGLPPGTTFHYADPEADLLHSLSPDFSSSTWMTPEEFKDENSSSGSCGAIVNQTRMRRMLMYCCITLLFAFIIGGAIAGFIVIAKGDNNDKSSTEHEDPVTVQAKPPTRDESGDAIVQASKVTQTLAPSLAQAPIPVPVLAPTQQPESTILAGAGNSGITSVPSAANKVNPAPVVPNNATPLNPELPIDGAAGWLLVGDQIRRSRTARMNLPIEASVVMSYDGTVLASASTSVVEVFRLGKDGWSLIGHLRAQGQVVSLGISHDGATVGYGSLMADSSCLIQIYRNTQNGGWNQIGQDLHGALGFRHSLSMNVDGNVIALGSPLEQEGAGKANVYDYDVTLQTWYQRGESIVGSTFYEYIGAVSLSSDGQTLAVGAPGASQQGVNSGRTQVYRYNGNAWVQIGQTLYGLVRLKQFGFSVALNKDGSRLAVGAPFAESRVDEKGCIYVYDLSAANEWTEVGVLGLVDSKSDEAGKSVQLSESGKTVAFSAPGDSTVHVRRQVDGIWEPYGEFKGSFLSVANDGSVVAICDVDDNESMTSVVRVLARSEADA